MARLFGLKARTGFAGKYWNRSHRTPLPRHVMHNAQRRCAAIATAPPSRSACQTPAASYSSGPGRAIFRGALLLMSDSPGDGQGSPAQEPRPKASVINRRNSALRTGPPLTIRPRLREPAPKVRPPAFHRQNGQPRSSALRLLGGHGLLNCGRGASGGARSGFAKRHSVAGLRFRTGLGKEFLQVQLLLRGRISHVGAPCFAIKKAAQHSAQLPGWRKDRRRSTAQAVCPVRERQRDSGLVLYPAKDRIGADAARSRCRAGCGSVP